MACRGRSKAARSRRRCSRAASSAPRVQVGRRRDRSTGQHRGHDAPPRPHRPLAREVGRARRVPRSDARGPHADAPVEAVARGKALFESAELGCASCHDGARTTDQSKHHLAGTLLEVDTPSLVGLAAASAPYFHDGSAPTLEALLRDRGDVHGMADAATRLDDAQVADLAAFLETL